MITIKIFLASSITEFASERKELEAFINGLNNIYHQRGIFFELIVCEDLSNAVQHESSQEAYNQEIRKSQYFYVIFGRKAGRFTLEEFDVALSSFREKGLPRVYTYFMVLPEGEEPDRSVIDFMRRLENELEYFHNQYTHIDSIKLNLILELVRDPRVGGTVTLENGQARLEGTSVMSMENIPLYSKNEAVQKLLGEQRNLEREFVLLAGLGDSEDAQRMRLRNSARRNEIAAQLHAMEMDVLGLCSRIEENRQSGKKLNWREAKALELADKGDYEAAKTLLRDEQWQKEVGRAEEMIAGAQEIIREYISGKRALIQMIRSSGITKHNEQEIIDIYEDACALAVKHHVKTDILHDYAWFLLEQKRYDRALEIAEQLCGIAAREETAPQQQAAYYNLLGILYGSVLRYREAETEYLKAKEIREKLAEENPGAFLPDLARTCNSLGALYLDTSRFDQAEELHLRAKAIREKLAAEKPAVFLPFLANTCYNLGILYGSTDRPGEAETEYLRAKAIQEKLAEEDPAAHLPDLAMNCSSLGVLYTNIPRYQEAETELLRAKEICEKLAEENPAASLPDLAVVCNNLGGLYKAASRHEKAERELLKAKGIFERLAEENPAAYFHQLGVICDNLGGLYRIMSRYGEAEAELLKAKEIREKLAEENPAVCLPDLATTCSNLGRLYSETLRDQEAETEYLRAKEIFFRLAEKGPSARLYGCIRICETLYSFYTVTGRPEQAEKEAALADECKARLKNDPEHGGAER